MDATLRRFACTQCGACCNRSPEVQLSEASSLADVFVLRLMFRVYWWPETLRDFLQSRDAPENGKEVFYQRKRLLNAFAARKSRVKVTRSAGPLDYTQYLMISALTVDNGSGACSALKMHCCSIYDRRPLACRTVPFHYSRVEASARSDFDAFVRVPGYDCETGNGAPAILEHGRILDRGIREARVKALALAEQETRWHAAILTRMKAPLGNFDGLPRLQYVEANSTFGATTASMRVAWQIAVEAGLMSDEDFSRLIDSQTGAIERELATGKGSPDTRETLLQMRTDYRSAAGSRRGLAFRHPDQSSSA